jgi:hypothetical protein
MLDSLYNCDWINRVKEKGTVNSKAGRTLLNFPTWMLFFNSVAKGIQNLSQP